MCVVGFRAMPVVVLAFAPASWFVVCGSRVCMVLHIYVRYVHAAGFAYSLTLVGAVRKTCCVRIMSVVPRSA